MASESASAGRGGGTGGTSRCFKFEAKSDPEIPNSRFPDSRFGRESGILAGNRGGNPRFPIRRESPIPESRPNRGFPNSRFGGNWETGNPRFPIRPGIGNRGPDSDGGGPGISWSEHRLPTSPGPGRHGDSSDAGQKTEPTPLSKGRGVAWLASGRCETQGPSGDFLGRPPGR